MDEETFIFIETVSDKASNINNGESIETDCPICNGVLTIGKSGYNGHKWAVCNKCGRKLME